MCEIKHFTKQGKEKELEHILPLDFLNAISRCME